MSRNKELTKKAEEGHFDGEDLGKLNEIKTVVTIRPDGSRRIRHYYDNCPTLAEQHTAHLSDINYLIKRYKPDELASYIAARSQHKQEIIGHDFSREPSLQDAKNIIYRSRQEFEALPEEIRTSFKNHLEFLKFIDNPANAEKMLKLGILTKKQIDSVKIPDHLSDDVQADDVGGQRKGVKNDDPKKKPE